MTEAHWETLRDDDLAIRMMEIIIYVFDRAEWRSVSSFLGQKPAPSYEA
jgi:hypothetical protein